jgi:hypothetical protein
MFASLEQWMRAERGRLSRYADFAKAMEYMLKRWHAFTRFLDALRKATAAARAISPRHLPDGYCYERMARTAWL